MKKYSVVWFPGVEDQLANLVVENWGTSLGQQIADASNLIDEQVASRPGDVGSLVSDNIRMITAGPLTVFYSVFTEDRKVVLLQYHLRIQ
jgi:hypothetical protein